MMKVPVCFGVPEMSPFLDSERPRGRTPNPLRSVLVDRKGRGATQRLELERIRMADGARRHGGRGGDDDVTGNNLHRPDDAATATGYAGRCGEEDGEVGRHSRGVDRHRAAVDDAGLRALSSDRCREGGLLPPWSAMNLRSDEFCRSRCLAMRLTDRPLPAYSRWSLCPLSRTVAFEHLQIVELNVRQSGQVLR
jgi:hypothetical protein